MSGWMELASPTHPTTNGLVERFGQAKEKTIMVVTEAQARRAIRRADFKWAAQVEDPRSERNQVHAHHGLLAVMAAAFACGRIRLRQVEDFTADLGTAAQRKLGIGFTRSATLSHIRETMKQIEAKWAS